MCNIDNREKVTILVPVKESDIGRYWTHLSQAHTESYNYIWNDCLWKETKNQWRNALPLGKLEKISKCEGKAET